MVEIARIETDRLIIRDWRDEDLDAWAALNADPIVMEFFPRTYEREASDETAAKIRAELSRIGYGWWALEERGGTPFIGVVALRETPANYPFPPSKEIGWRLAHGAWGHGYAPEAARAVARYAFETLDAENVIAITAVQNARSRRVMEKIGMVYDPADDFDHPALDFGHPLRRHVLYTLTNAQLR